MKMRRNDAWLARVVRSVGLAVLGALPASAQTSTPPAIEHTVVVTATITPTDLAQVSRSLSLVTGDELRLMGIQSVIEGLRFVPGVDARARGPRDVQTDLSIRGATFGQNLVLADGLRLNDSHSGHHNGEIPLPLVAVDRLEVLLGAGSAVHGADALGGTINVVSRRGDFTAASASVGEHAFVDAQVAVGGQVLPASWTAAGWMSRSAGFIFDRDFAQGGAAVRGDIGSGVSVDVRHQRRAFGANGFYGPSPSKEWTDQTLAAATWRGTSGGWSATTTALFRNHGDHFRWDILRPGFAENRHRTDAGDVSVIASRHTSRGSVALGASGSADRVRSSNLGDHNYRRVSAFGEWQTALAGRSTMQAGLRLDAYSTFGEALSPSLSVVSALSDVLRVRASAARAFRVPTFTELYYSDPSNLGNDDLVAERSWSVDGGLDWQQRAWQASVSVYRRWDSDVIDWLRETPVDRWRSTNVRDVRARGFEFSLGRRWAGALLRIHYAAVHLDAPALSQLSKYVLEYARHQSGGSLTLPLGAGFRFAVNVDHRHRRDGQSYDLVAARVSRSFGRVDLSVDGTNVLDATYHEVAGVAMPGRWLTFGVSVR